MKGSYVQDCYKKVFATAEGQVVLEDLCKAHFVYNSTFSPDANTTIMREGERNVVLRLLAVIRAKPNAFALTTERIEDDN